MQEPTDPADAPLELSEVELSEVEVPEPSERSRRRIWIAGIVAALAIPAAAIAFGFGIRAFTPPPEPESGTCFLLDQEQCADASDAEILAEVERAASITLPDGAELLASASDRWGVGSAQRTSRTALISLPDAAEPQLDAAYQDLSDPPLRLLERAQGLGFTNVYFVGQLDAAEGGDSVASVALGSDAAGAALALVHVEPAE